MFFILITILVIALVGLFFIDRQQKKIKEKRQRESFSDSNYLKQVEENTAKRLRQEQEQQEYKNKIKQDYL
jgi:Tfp pilus assembly protein PilO